MTVQFLEFSIDKFALDKCEISLLSRFKLSRNSLKMQHMPPVKAKNRKMCILFINEINTLRLIGQNYLKITYAKITYLNISVI